MHQYLAYESPKWDGSNGIAHGPQMSSQDSLTIIGHIKQIQDTYLFPPWASFRCTSKLLKEGSITNRT